MLASKTVGRLDNKLGTDRTHADDAPDLPRPAADVRAGPGGEVVQEDADRGDVRSGSAVGLMVATIPLSGYDKLPADALAGRTVIDTMNYCPDRIGHIAESDAGGLTSSTLVQRHLADSRVVKAFNSIDYVRLFTSARPAGNDDRSALPIAGDGTAAKEQGAEPLNALGYDAVDVATLDDSRRSEPGTPVYVQPYDVRRRGHGIQRLRHPVVGELTLSFEAMGLPGDTDQSLVVHHAEPGSTSRKPWGC